MLFLDVISRDGELSYLMIYRGDKEMLGSSDVVLLII
jgi:hypothetical protein